MKTWIKLTTPFLWLWALIEYLWEHTDFKYQVLGWGLAIGSIVIGIALMEWLF